MLILTRKAGESVRLVRNGVTTYLDIQQVTGGNCTLRVLSLEPGTPLKVDRVRFKASMPIIEGVTVTVLDLNKGHAKLGFDAPRDVHILRTELIKEAS
jgi:sRNA-binding carbon storage regulator CsrA